MCTAAMDTVSRLKSATSIENLRAIAQGAKKADSTLAASGGDTQHNHMADAASKLAQQAREGEYGSPVQRAINAVSGSSSNQPQHQQYY